MIPSSAADVAKLVASFERQTLEARALFADHGDAVLWRPSEQKWSVAGHVAHLCILNGPYVEAMKDCLMKARAKGLLSDGPYKHGWFGPWFAGQMAPPPKKRWKTQSNMVPDPSLDGADVLGRFERIQGDLQQLAHDATGIDLGRARFSSPFMKLMRFSLGAGLGVLDAHNDRHLWLAREVVAWDGFPG